MKNGIIRDYTKGPLFGPLVRFSLPFMLSNALQVLYTTVDMFVVGNCVGVNGLSAVTNAGRLVDFFIVLCIGLSMSGQIYIAQLIGQGRRQELNRTIGTLFTFLLAMGAVMSVLGVASARTLIRWIRVPAGTERDALSYLTCCSSGLLFSYGYNMVSSVLRGMGDSKRPFLFVAIASIANLVLDIAFVKYLGMGVFGAALATVLAQALSFLFALAHLYRRRDAFGFDFRPRSFRMDRAILRALLRVGIPIAIRFSAINISMMYVLSLVNGVGIAASALFGTGVKLDDIVTKITMGIMQATTVVVGQNYGAHQFGRIRRAVVYAWILSFGFYAVYTFFLLRYPETMFGFFLKDNPEFPGLREEVLALAPLFARTIVWQFPGLVIMRGTNGFINGIGHTRLSLLFGLFDGVVLRIGCSWFLGDVVGLGLQGYILGFAVACYGTGIPSLVYFFFFPWEKRKAVTVLEG